MYYHYFNTSHVTVYHITHYCVQWSFGISIHLMLLFIEPHLCPYLSKKYFNTSHVTVYHRWNFTKQCRNTYFNTSHVTVYPSIPVFPNLGMIISIHLMLLFIPIEDAIPSTIPYFNTSHVTVYRLLQAGKEDPDEDFNTSHVTVYPDDIQHDSFF